MNSVAVAPVSVRERWHPPLVWLAVAMFALVFFAAGGMVIDHRVITGLPAWDKPAKFALSVLIYAVTWAWLIPQLPRGRRVAQRAGTVAAALLGVEMVVIVVQVVRGTTSHFNVSSPLNSALWYTMGVSIAATWLATAVMSALLFRNPGPDRARTLGIRYGSLLSLLGMALGFLMVGPKVGQHDLPRTISGAHTVGLPDGGPGLPLLGWSTVGGDLRIPHFVGIHALQVIPLVVIALELLSRRVGPLRDGQRRATLVTIAVAAYTALLGVVTWQALRGESVVHPQALTLVSVAAIAAATAGAATWVVVRR
ncbi:hypothetical protein VMT65_28620 [Nocardia sp. CDC153]|uniref:hypothetical protein n=1 Tax=Nocardia sp. CDC153 TaxID=3112167 RepID=UPI002DBD531A|nr:hypothetical protein [Nocardia sp. CDC153]MEC3957031.1 hypothetical protein [Nocardia sp. CDC153]